MRPFLKWAGGKYYCLHHIIPHLPDGQRLIEPFAGSAALSLNSEYPSYLLSDINPDLVKVFQCLQKEGLGFIDYCEHHFAPENNSKEAYYAKRARFNQLRTCREKASLFIYLNRHAYNGLCRYNSKGEFNVPFGSYKKPLFPRQSMECFHHKSQHMEILRANFNQTLAQAKLGDIIYCDPPYVPLSQSAYFTAYSKQQFGKKQQLQLANLAKKKAAEGIPVIISNHDTQFTRTCYQGAHIIEFEVPRRISCKVEQRRKVPELLAIFT